MAYVIAEPCINVKDKACVEVCPVDCIYEGETMLYIHPDECIDCGACPFCLFSFVWLIALPSLGCTPRLGLPSPSCRVRRRDSASP